MLLYPKTAASNALTPSQGERAAWALDTVDNSETDSGLLELVRMAEILDLHAM